MLGYVNHRSLPKFLLDHPDEVDQLPSGRVRRRWYRQSVWNFADTRIDRHSTGRPPGTTPPCEARSYANDPRLDTAVQHLRQHGETTRGLASQLARRLQITERTARRLIAAARALPQLEGCSTATISSANF